MGDWWRFYWRKSVVHERHGEVHGQTCVDTRVIEVDEALGDQKALEIVLHEAFHALNWVAGEKVVTEAARDVSRLVHRLGWRRS